MKMLKMLKAPKVSIFDIFAKMAVDGTGIYQGKAHKKVMMIGQSFSDNYLHSRGPLLRRLEKVPGSQHCGCEPTSRRCLLIPEGIPSALVKRLVKARIAELRKKRST